MKFKKILVPVDLSIYSDRALEYALRLGNRYQSHLTLLYVYDSYTHQNTSIQSQKSEYLTILKKMIDRMEKKILKENGNYHEIPFTVKVFLGKHIPDLILKFIDDNKFDLVIMETHARIGIQHMLLGSVTEKVVRMSAKPVLTVHHAITDFNIKKILVPIDFSVYSKKAAEYAISLANEFYADIIFFHVIPHEFHPEFHGTGLNALFQIAPAMKAHTTEKLREFIGYKKDNGIYLVVEGKSCQSIMEYAEYSKCNLIVMATRGLTGFKHLLVGSTTEKVVRIAKCPVLTLGKVEQQNENLKNELETAMHI